MCPQKIEKADLCLHDNKESNCNMCKSPYYSWKTLAVINIAVLILSTIAIIFSLADVSQNFPEEKACWRNNLTFPKTIHQIWNNEHMPLKWKETSNTCKDMYPEYKYKLWTFTDLQDLIHEYYPWFLPTYITYKYDIQRIDAAKYFLLYKFGGIYLDVDFSCNKSIQPVLDVMLSSNPNKDIILERSQMYGLRNGLMVAKPKTDFLKFVTYNLTPSQRSYIFNYATVMLTTGPYWLERIYDKYNCKESVYAVPNQFFTGQYLTHHGNLGWIEWDGILIRAIYYNPIKSIILGLIILIIIVRIVSYWKRGLVIGEDVSNIIIEPSEENKNTKH